MRAASRRSPVFVAGIVLLMSAAACGGAGHAAPTPVAAAEGTTTSTTVEPGAAYTACLREHGVNLPDRPPRTAGAAGDTPPSSRPPGSRPPGSRPSTSLPTGTDQAAVQAARDACKALVPADRPNGPGMQTGAFQAYASCLKDHGVVLPDGGGFGGVNRDDAAFKAADAVCAPLRPTQGTQP